MRVTVSELAKSCGVSIATVSNILNGKGVYREETRSLVHETATRLGYRTNASARAMVTGRFGCYALVLSPKPSASILPFGLLESLDAAMSASGLHLILSRLPDQQLTNPGYVPKILSHMLADGLLINYNIGVPERLAELLQANRIPAVWLNHDRPLDAVLPDDLQAGRDAVALLLAHGHCRIAWLDINTGPDDHGWHYSQTERRLGVRDAVSAAGLSLNDLGRNGGLPVVERLPRVTGALAAPDRPTAVVCYSAEAVSSICLAAAHCGLSIPRDLSVIAFNDRSFALGSTELDIMQIDAALLGTSAVDMLGQLVGGAAPQRSRRIPLRHHVGATLGPAPG